MVEAVAEVGRLMKEGVALVYADVDVMTVLADMLLSVAFRD